MSSFRAPGLPVFAKFVPSRSEIHGRFDGVGLALAKHSSGSGQGVLAQGACLPVFTPSVKAAGVDQAPDPHPVQPVVDTKLVIEDTPSNLNGCQVELDQVRNQRGSSTPSQAAASVIACSSPSSRHTIVRSGYRRRQRAKSSATSETSSARCSVQLKATRGTVQW